MENLSQQEECKTKKSQIFLENLMQQALQQAKEGLQNNEVPVGCIFAEIQTNETYKIIEKAYNKTNESKNAINHCEMICIQKLQKQQKQESFKNLTLFVTVEPCIMCAYALNIIGLFKFKFIQKGIKEVYFGCFNDKFGGNGSILKLNEIPPNSYKIQGHILEKECIDLLQQFFIIGNQNIPEEKRNRKKKVKQEII